MVCEAPNKLERQKLRACWHHMLQRCYDEKCVSYPCYGGRGITVCDEWRSDANAFIEWALANGFKIGLTIDRRENDLGYSPDNCRFVTRKVNQQNRRKPAGSVSRFLGVSLTKNKQRWQAFIQQDGGRKYIGTFDAEEDAARAYDSKAVELYGPEAKVNFPKRRPA